MERQKTIKLSSYHQAFLEEAQADLEQAGWQMDGFTMRYDHGKRKYKLTMKKTGAKPADKK